MLRSLKGPFFKCQISVTDGAWSHAPSRVRREPTGIYTMRMDLGPHSWIPGFVLAAITGLASYYYYRRGRNFSALDYEVISDNQIIFSASELSDMRSTIAQEKLTVVKPRLIRVRYINTGTRAIVASDFIQPIRLPEDFITLKITPQKNSPIKLAISGKPGSNRRRDLAVPDVVNPGESFVIRYFTDGGPDEIRPQFRVVGLSKPASDLRRVKSAFGGALGFASGIAMFTWLLWPALTGPKFGWLTVVICLVTGFIFGSTVHILNFLWLHYRAIYLSRRSN